MHKKEVICNDAGSVHCPCVLAACGKCMTCSRLAGKEFCDCKWQGVCVYNEYIQNGSLAAVHRKNLTCRIQKKIWYGDDLVVMRIDVPRGFAEKASLPGSYVFVRPEGNSVFFDMPVSVLRADYEDCTIDLLIKINGIKSKEAAGAEELLAVRGVYSNGLLHSGKLRLCEPKRVLCVSKGVGISPVVNYCRWAHGRNKIDVIVDTDKITRSAAADCFFGCSLNSLSYESLSTERIIGLVDEYDIVVLCASDYFQENIYIPDDKKVLSNNFTMCCGEGICGACVYTDDKGKTYRMCKCIEK